VVHETGILPTDWKFANVCPVFKKGPRSDVGNHRPISLTSVPCKIMESIIKDRIVRFLESSEFFSRYQHGFVKGRSCLTNLLETFEAWTKALDDGYDVHIVYLDYRKAFDTVPHSRLLDKLKAIGIDDTMLACIKDFLLSRRMRVCVRKSVSGWVLVVSGVPQVSVSGPLLFLVYVNDLPKWIVNSIRMFADDTNIWTVITTDQDIISLQSDLNKLADWSDEWLLRFNIDKCKVMHLGPRQKSTYHIRDGSAVKELKETEEEKDLGVCVTPDLKPSTHCGRAASKASISTWIDTSKFHIYRQRQFLDPIQILYQATPGILCAELVTKSNQRYYLFGTDSTSSH